jgi:hypothetical protein
MEAAAPGEPLEAGAGLSAVEPGVLLAVKTPKIIEFVGIF